MKRIGVQCSKARVMVNSMIIEEMFSAKPLSTKYVVPAAKTMTLRIHRFSSHSANVRLPVGFGGSGSSSKTAGSGPRLGVGANRQIETASTAPTAITAIQL